MTWPEQYYRRVQKAPPDPAAPTGEGQPIPVEGG